MAAVGLHSYVVCMVVTFCNWAMYALPFRTEYPRGYVYQEWLSTAFVVVGSSVRMLTLPGGMLVLSFSPSYLLLNFVSIFNIMMINAMIRDTNLQSVLDIW